jgi:hypothetical protein
MCRFAAVETLSEHSSMVFFFCGADARTPFNRSIFRWCIYLGNRNIRIPGLAYSGFITACSFATPYVDA